MNTWFRILAVLSVVCLVTGLSDIGSSMLSGLLRAMGAVLFALAYITKAIHKAETTH